MPDLEPSYVIDLGARMFGAIGASDQEARLVAEELVRADLMGVTSHGVMRIPEYIRAGERGDLKPGAAIQVLNETPTTAIVDCGRNFGQVGAYRALDVAIAKARQSGIGCVVTRNCHHTGRVGAYAEAAARQDLICLATVAVRRRGHFVTPWGGTQGRLGTNPISYGIPTEGEPLVTDFATSVIPEGAVRVALQTGALLPEYAAVDAHGQPIRDPAKFYGPPIGALLPFGGNVGYKGYALALVAEVLGATLGGYSVKDETRSANGVWILVLDPAAFLPIAEFKRLTSELVAYLKSSPPADTQSQVLVPGEREFRRLADSNGAVFIDEETWAQIVVTAGRLGVPIQVENHE
jgi:hydroxycarboxylate dehydrogenase B